MGSYFLVSGGGYDIVGDKVYKTEMLAIYNRYKLYKFIY